MCSFYPNGVRFPEFCAAMVIRHTSVGYLPVTFGVAAET